MYVQHTTFEGGEDSHEGGKIPPPPWHYVEKTLVTLCVDALVSLSADLPVSFESWKDDAGSGWCWVFLGLLHGVWLSGPDLVWTLRLAADA